jgi:hypothetical protein
VGARNVTTEYRWLEDNYDRLPALTKSVWCAVLITQAIFRFRRDYVSRHRDGLVG